MRLIPPLPIWCIAYGILDCLQFAAGANLGLTTETPNIGVCAGRMSPLPSGNRVR